MPSVPIIHGGLAFRIRLRIALPIAFCFTMGCSTMPGGILPASPGQTTQPLRVTPPTIIPARADEEITVLTAVSLNSVPSESTLPGTGELTEAELVQQVLLRNPTVVQMAAAAQAAAARYPQVTSLDDPRAGGFVGPATIDSSSVDFAYRLEISQAIPFPGKRSLRGETARNEAHAADRDLEDTRLGLIESARSAYAEYYLTARAIEVNEESIKLLQEFRENAASRYRAGQGEQQDVYQAEVAIARQRERASTLERLRRVAQARINTLMNSPPDQSLPPPPKEIAKAASLPPAPELRESALKQRPDVAALQARVRADEATVALAQKEYYPDFEAMAVYDTFWQRPERDLRPMVGVRLNLPVQIGRRDAALAEALARMNQRRAELSRLTAQVAFQVQEAYEQLKESERSLKLYEESALPAARENVRLARASYATGKVPFISLIEAQRNLVELRDRQFELQTESRRRRAVLDRVVGTSSTTITLDRSAGIQSEAPPLSLPDKKDPK